MLTDDYLVFIPDTEETEGELFLATVADVTSAGVSILFDGSDTGTTKYYKQLNTGVTLSENDRILVMRQSGSYVVLGKIAYTNSGGGGGGDPGDDYVKKTGDTMTGNLDVENGSFRRKLPVVANNTTYYGLRFLSSTGTGVGSVSYRRNSSPAGQGLRITGANIVNGSVLSNYFDLMVDDSGNRYVAMSHPASWQKALDTHYLAGDSVTFGTLSYTQFAGGMRANNALNFTIPLAKPVASGVTATASGKFIAYAGGSYRTIDLSDTNLTVTTLVDGSGVTLHIVFTTNPSWYSAQELIGIQAYGLTITFS